MKKIVLAICVLAAVSCQKEVKTKEDAVLGNQQAAESSNAVTLNRQTKFGCLISGSFTSDENVDITKSLSVEYVRSALVMDQWQGKYQPYENYTANGIKVILNVNHTRYENKQVPFPKDLTSYRKTLTEITNKYQPEVISIENEEINKSYHSGPITNYINMLSVALDVCHAKGIKVTNGGIYGTGLEILTYRYLQTKGQKRADSFANNCMESFQVKAAQTPNSNKTLESDAKKIDTLLNFYSNLDYVNVHMYEPFDPDVYSVASKASGANKFTSVVVADIQEFLRYRTGRPTMTNETGQRNNTSPELVTSVLQEYDRLKFPYVIWFSGDGEGGAEPLHDLRTGTLKPNGVAFSNFNKSY